MNTGADSAIEARESGVHVVDYLKSRGYVQDISDEPNLRKAFDDGIVTAYIGFDPTARSLHIGNQLGIMLLAVLQRFGHQPVALGGGGTALVGDPSGRTSVRDVLSEEQIRQNLRSILPQFDRFLDFKGNRFGSNPPALLMNNADWLLELNYIEFLRDIGRHFSVNEMLAAETYKVRVDTGAGLNFVEFNYRIVQAYDFLHLYRTTGCRLQMGGSDQWGNIVAGVDLIRRVEGVQAFALVSPLITAASGEKLGKSAGNSVWLEGSMTSAFDYYQYWINVDDADVERLLKLFTFVSNEEIARLTSVSGDALRDAKRVLAREVTALAHGAQAAQEADASAQALFGSDSLEAMLADPNVPSAVIPGDLLANGITIAEAFIEAGLVASRGEARRLASQGGLSINGERIEEVDAAFIPSNAPQLFRVGKKRYKRVHSE
ncbi:MAG: tyrosine--tRNA ligase [Thermomicrobiales bacterium]|nr:tyrosine--tRNA ligase [Thermomicrobiales bacterium]